MLYDTMPTIVKLTKAQYDALDPADKTNDTIYFITDVNGDGQNFQPVIYSEEEHEIGVWTDGKPLYEKTITGTTDSSNFETQVNHGISNLDTVVSIEGSIRCATQWQTFIEHSRPSNEEYARISDTIISLVSTDGDWRGKPFHFTLRYTKTTDTPGSGKWTPQGVPAVHYSTDEQIVGTWIDGKPLYEKTLKVGTTSSTSEQYFETNILSADVDTYFIKESFIITSTGLAWTTGGSNDSFFHILFLSNGTTNLRVSSRVSSNAMYGDLYATIRYTKSST